MPSDLQRARIGQYLGEAQAEHMKLLSEFLSMPSVSNDPENVRLCGQWLAQLMQQCGLNAELFETGGNPILVGRLGVETRSAPTVLLYAHYDVQPPGPISAWVSQPFEPEVRDGSLFARGAADDKSQILAILLAIRTLLATDVPIPNNLILLFEGEEEAGSPNLPEFCLAHLSSLRADIALAIDGKRHYTEVPTLRFGIRGGLSIDVRVKTAPDDLSLSYQNIAQNAAVEIAHLAASLFRDDGKVAVPGFEEGIIPPTDEEESWLRDLEFDTSILREETGLPLPDGFDTVDFMRETIFSSVLNVTGLSAGYSGDGHKSSIPNSGLLKIDCRLALGQEPTLVLQQVEQYLRHCCRTGMIEINVDHRHPPSRTNATDPRVRWFIKAFKDAVAEDVALIPSFGGTGPHKVFVDTLEAPLIWVALPQADCNTHRANENIRLDVFFEGIELMCKLLLSSGLPRGTAEDQHCRGSAWHDENLGTQKTDR